MKSEDRGGITGRWQSSVATRGGERFGAKPLLLAPVARGEETKDPTPAQSPFTLRRPHKLYIHYLARVVSYSIHGAPFK